jgi:hypothetical protein
MYLFSSLLFFKGSWPMDAFFSQDFAYSCPAYTISKSVEYLAQQNPGENTFRTQKKYVNTWSIR